MARKHATQIYWDMVEVLGKVCIFAEYRVDRKTIPKGCYMYEVRHSDNDWTEPIEIGLGILANFYGTLLTTGPLDLTPIDGLENSYAEIEPTDWKYLGGIVSFKEKS